jgi:hypothetical protein
MIKLLSAHMFLGFRRVPILTLNLSNLRFTQARDLPSLAMARKTMATLMRMIALAGLEATA